MTVGYTENLSRNAYRTMDARNQENTELLACDSGDPRELRDNMRRALINSANNAALNDVVSKLVGQVYKNAKTAMQNKG